MKQIRHCRKAVQLLNKQKELEGVGGQVVEIENRLCRISATLAGDVSKNLAIAKLSNQSTKKKSVVKCTSLVCCMTSVDIEVNWVQCDECNKWLHTHCEFFTPAEELSIENIDEYVCLSCRDIAPD